VNTSAGIEYINQERFEELLCWFELPPLVELAASDPLFLGDVARVASSATHLKVLLQRAGFGYQRFLELLSLEPMDGHDSKTISQTPKLNGSAGALRAKELKG
jgi:hypothetical protein